MGKGIKLNELTVGPTEFGRIVGATRHRINDQLFRSLSRPEKPGKYPLPEVMAFLWDKLNEKTENQLPDEMGVDSDKISKEEADRRMAIEKLERTRLENDLRREALISKSEVLESLKAISQINRTKLEDFLINQVPKRVVGMKTVGEIRSEMKEMLNLLLGNIQKEIEKYEDPQGDGHDVEAKSSLR